MNRLSELAGNLERVEMQIAKALSDLGRDRSEVKLIVVSKNFPVSDIDLLYQLGVRDFGENREQEAREKVQFFAERTASASNSYQDICWHFQGQLQRNKLASIGTWADTVHSIDDRKYLHGLSAAAIAKQRQLTCLIQISLDRDDHQGRGGIDLVHARELLLDFQARRSELSAITLAGVMGVAPLGQEPSRAFSDLEKAFYELQAIAPDFSIISSGMSGDFIQALSYGATHLRIGSSILGSRG